MSLPRLTHASLTIALAASLMAAQAQAATFSTDASAYTGTRNTSGPTDIQSVVNSPLFTGPLKAESTVSESSGPPQFGLAVGSADSTAIGTAGLAWLDLSASARSQLSTLPGGAAMAAGATALSGARFTDSFVITCPDPISCAAGQMGHITIAYVVQAMPGGGGHVTPTGILSNGGFDGFAQWRASINLQSTYGANDGPNYISGNAFWQGGQTIKDSQLGPYKGPYNNGTPYADPGTQLLSIDFTFGAPIFVDMAANAGASANVGYDSSGSTAQSSFAVNPFRAGWGGIVSITGVEGAAISGVTALSADTGVNYFSSQVAAVPEPEVAWMLAAGGVLVLRRARRTQAT